MLPKVLPWGAAMKFVRIDELKEQIGGAAVDSIVLNPLSIVAVFSVDGITYISLSSKTTAVPDLISTGMTEAEVLERIKKALRD